MGRMSDLAAEQQQTEEERENLSGFDMEEYEHYIQMNELNKRMCDEFDNIFKGGKNEQPKRVE